ncbi:hypothetical protein GQ53DRAFT_844379 [Thozetella sp. PMI_491]|nr:hypothetical protein GQ53DRAFT_844379 [Thozetella sp. PMI_491]
MDAPSNSMPGLEEIDGGPEASSALDTNAWSPSPNLVSMPPELLLMIFQSFCYHCTRDDSLDRAEGRRTLANLAGLCKSLRGPAQHILFHEFIADDFTDGRTLLFAKSLVCRPELGNSVRRLKVDLYWNSFCEDMVFFYSNLSHRNPMLKKFREDAASFFEAVQHCWTHLQKKADPSFLADCSSPYNFATARWRAVNAILLLAPQLEVVRIRAAVHVINHLLSKWLPRQGGPPRLSNLRKLKLHASENAGPSLLGASYSWLIFLLEDAPNLRTLLLKRFVHPLGGSVQIPTLENLRYVRIQGPPMSREIIQHLVAACPNVTSFTFRADHSNYYNDKVDASPLELVNTFAPWHKSLEHLDLPYELWSPEDFLPMHDVIESFQEFTTLKTLRLSAVAIEPWWDPFTVDVHEASLVDLLPEGIQGVELVGIPEEDDWQDVAVCALAGLKKAVSEGRFPDLGSITLLWNNRLGGGVPWGDVQGLFANSRIIVTQFIAI